MGCYGSDAKRFSYAHKKLTVIVKSRVNNNRFYELQQSNKSILMIRIFSQ